VRRLYWILGCYPLKTSAVRLTILLPSIPSYSIHMTVMMLKAQAKGQ